MKIIDGFIFYNELQLLNYRLHLLYEVVDMFIIVESTHTFMGVPKPLFFKENDHLFTKFMSKIVHVVVNNMPHVPPNVTLGEQWHNEYHQRDCIQIGIRSLSLAPEDVILITDVDEIPDPRTLTLIKTGVIPVTFMMLGMDLYFYNLNHRLPYRWYHPKLISYQEYTRRNQLCSMLRNEDNLPCIANGGWHLSYFGSPSFIQNKIRMFSHQEFNYDEHTNVSVIEQRIASNRDLYNRGSDPVYIPIRENTYLPVAYNVFLFQFAIQDKTIM